VRLDVLASVDRMSGTITSIPRVQPAEVGVRWGVMYGEQHYLISCGIQPLAMSGPPAWMTFEFGAPPEGVEPTGDDVAEGLASYVAQLGCRIVTVSLVAVDVDTYRAASTQ
jgi:hypothetical protein